MGIYQGLSSVKQQDANAELLVAQAEKTRAETLAAEQYSALAQAELRKRQLEGHRTAEEIPRTQEEARRAKAEATLSERTVDSRHSQSESDARRKFWEAELGKDSFSADVARRRAMSKLVELEVPRAQSEAEFWDSKTGEIAPYLKTLLQILQGISSGKRAFGGPKE